MRTDCCEGSEATLAKVGAARPRYLIRSQVDADCLDGHGPGKEPMTLRHWLSTSMALGIVAAFGLVLCALALQDIAHGEADVRNEWWAVRIGLFLTGLFIAATLVTLVKVRAARQSFAGPAGS